MSCAQESSWPEKVLTLLPPDPDRTAVPAARLLLEEGERKAPIPGLRCVGLSLPPLKSPEPLRLLLAERAADPRLAERCLLLLLPAQGVSCFPVRRAPGDQSPQDKEGVSCTQQHPARTTARQALAPAPAVPRESPPFLPAGRCPLQFLLPLSARAVWRPVILQAVQEAGRQCLFKVHLPLLTVPLRLPRCCPR